MSVLRPVSRFAGRAVGATVVARTAKRYPIVVVAMFLWRWLRRRELRVARTRVRLRAGETITVQQKQR